MIWLDPSTNDLIVSMLTPNLSSHWVFHRKMSQRARSNRKETHSWICSSNKQRKSFNRIDTSFIYIWIEKFFLLRLDHAKNNAIIQEYFCAFVRHKYLIVSDQLQSIEWFGDHRVMQQFPRKTSPYSIRKFLLPQVEGSEIRTRQYTDVNVHQTERIRPYSAVLHGSVLRSFFSVSYTRVYKSFTIENDLSNMSFRAVNDVCMQKCTENIYNDDKQPFSCARRWPYFIVNDTEEYSRNTEPCNTECYGKIRSRRPY